jgi:queuine/archaeosine tRNA-ribosyltransferase
MEKKLFKDKAGNVHFGINAPDGFVPCEKADVEKALSKIGKRKLWRCNVCNDLHLNSEPPKVCPTCTTSDAYVEISLQEFKTVIGI